MTFDTVQDLIVSYVPELDSKYTQYPMQHEFPWHNPRDTGPTGEPCFVKSSNQGLRRDYVFGPGMLGVGYYHVLTQQAHRLAEMKFRGMASPVCCGGISQSKTYNRVRRILEARVLEVVDRPNDALAEKTQKVLYQERKQKDSVSLIMQFIPFFIGTS